MEACYSLICTGSDTSQDSYYEKWPTHKFTQLQLGQDQTNPNINYYLFLQQLRVGMKVISMYNWIQNYPFSLNIPYGEGGMGQNNNLENSICFALLQKACNMEK